MNGASRLKQALETKSLTALTKALGEIAQEFAFQLKPPYTEILEFKAKEEAGRFALHFRAKLYLHYSRLADPQSGLIFVIRFDGDALSDSPAPPLPDLFYAGNVGLFRVYAYGTRWKGEPTIGRLEFVESLELPAETLYEIGVDRFCELLRSGL